MALLQYRQFYIQGAILQVFDIPNMLGITFEQAMWLSVWTIGIIGSIYAIFEDYVVAISDTINMALVYCLLVMQFYIRFHSIRNGDFYRYKKQ